MVKSPGSIRVLHVDDEPAFTTLAIEFLKREDDRITVESATDASNALERLAANGFDCIVSDYDMPGQDGIEFLEAVRSDHPDLPFILYTGKGSEEVASEAISKGVTDYLQKEHGTSQYEVLANRIDNAVSGYLIQRQLAVQKEQYQRLFEEAPVMYAVTRNRGGEPLIEDCNRRFVDRLGYSRDEVIDKPLSAFYTPESAETLLEGGGYDRALAGEFIIEERRFATADGEELETMLRAVPRFDEHGELVGTLALFVDMTVQRNRERAMQELHAFATGLADYDDATTVCERTVTAAQTILDFDMCVVKLATDGYFSIAATSEELPAGSAKPMSVEEGLAGKCFRTGETLLIDDVQSHPEAEPQGPYRSGLCIPVADHGVFLAVAEQPGAFDSTDQDLAELLISHTANVLHRLDGEGTLG